MPWLRRALPERHSLILPISVPENRKVGGSTPPLATSPTSVTAGQTPSSLPPRWAATARRCPCPAPIGRPLSHADRTRRSPRIGVQVRPLPPPLADVLPTRA